MEFENVGREEEYRKKQDEIRKKLSTMEDEILKTVSAIFQSGADARWVAIGKTGIEQGFMALKRAVYDGKRVGDP